MSFEELYNLALKNYENGGDCVVECWDENTLAEYEAEFGKMTKERALAMFRTVDSVRRDIENA